MIAPLRRRHRWLTGLLAVVVPVLYALALIARPAAVSEGLPEALSLAVPGSGQVVVPDLAFDGLPLSARVMKDGADWKIEIVPSEPLAKPEVLAYWTPADSSAETLSADAWLLGAVGGIRPQAFGVPEAVQGRGGRLVLYSLGHQEVLGSVALPAIGSLPEDPAPEVGETTEAGETPAQPAPGRGSEGSAS